MDNPFTSADSSDFAISYEISNKETIILRSQHENNEEASLPNRTENAQDNMEVDSSSLAEISIFSDTNSEFNHELLTNADNMLDYLLKICFNNDKRTRIKIARKIRTHNLMALENSTGTFQLMVDS